MTTDSERLSPLMEKYLDGQLTPDERRALAALLAQEARFRAQFIEWVEQEAALRAIFRTDAAPLGHQESASAPAPDCGKAPRRVVTPGRPWRRWVMGLAASLMVGLGVSFWLPRPGWVAASAVARVEQVRGEVYVVAHDAKMLVRSGHELSSGQGLQTVGEASSAVVLYPDGTRLEAAADTTLRELSGGRGAPASRTHAGKKVFLAEGSLTADVAKQPPGQPMLLTTPHAEVLVRGTKFCLSNGAEATCLEIEQGAVQLTRTSDGQSAEVPAGFVAVATGGVEPLAPQPSGPRLHTARLTLDGSLGVAFSPDGTLLATTRIGMRTVDLRDSTTGRQRTAFRGHPGIRALLFFPDGQTLATGSLDRTVTLWEVATGESKATLEGHPGPVSALAYSVDGHTLAVMAGEGQTVTRWDLSTGQPRGDGQSYPSGLSAFSPDGRMLAAVSDDPVSVTVWDLAMGRVRATLPLRRTVDIRSLAFSPDGTLLAIGRHGMVMVWNLATGQVRRNLPRGFMAGRVHAMAFSPDGTLLATADSDSTVKLWDVGTGRKRATLEGHPGRVRSLVFAPDGKTLATATVSKTTEEGTVMLWDMPPGDRTSSLLQAPPPA